MQNKPKQTKDDTLFVTWKQKRRKTQNKNKKLLQKTLPISRAFLLTQANKKTHLPCFKLSANFVFLNHVLF